MYHQQAIRNAKPHYNVSKLTSNIGNFDKDEVVSINSSQNFPNPSDKPMSDTLNDILESSYDNLGNLISYNIYSHFSNIIIAKVKNSFQIYTKMELLIKARGKYQKVKLVDRAIN